MSHLHQNRLLCWKVRGFRQGSANSIPRKRHPHPERRRYFLSLEFCISEFHISSVASGVKSNDRPRTVPPLTRASPTTHSTLWSGRLTVCLRFASARTKPKTLSQVPDVTFTLKIFSSGQVRGKSVKHRTTSSTTHVQHTYMLVRCGRHSSSALFGLGNGQVWGSRPWSPLKHREVTESRETSVRAPNKVVKRAPAVRSVRLNDCVRDSLMPTIDTSMEEPVPIAWL